MKTLNRHNVQFCSEDEEAKLIVLNSFDDFKKWYLSFHEFDMFSEAEVSALINEEKPDEYPCIPLFNDDTMGVVYINNEVFTLYCQFCKASTC